MGTFAEVLISALINVGLFQLGVHSGRKQERTIKQMLRPIRLVLEISGETIGAVEIAGVRVDNLPDVIADPPGRED